MDIQPLAYNPAEPQYPQTLDWSCSACSLAWLNRALGIQFATDESQAIAYIGYADNINSLYGLMDASGSRLRDCLREQGAPAFCCWPSWQEAYYLAERMPLLIGGIDWNHWVGVRGVVGADLSLANSARGWQSIYDVLSEGDWYNLGPFAAVPVPLLGQFPPLPTS